MEFVHASFTQGNGLKGQRLGKNSNPTIYALKGQYKYLIHASMSQSLSRMNLHANPLHLTLFQLKLL